MNATTMNNDTTTTTAVYDKRNKKRAKGGSFIPRGWPPHPSFSTDWLGEILLSTKIFIFNVQKTTKGHPRTHFLILFLKAVPGCGGGGGNLLMVKAKRGGKIKKITQRLPDTIGVPVVACASCEKGGSYELI